MDATERGAKHHLFIGRVVAVGIRDAHQHGGDRSDDANVLVIGVLDTGGFGLTAHLEVSLPALDKETAERMVAQAHQVCPYSNATRGNMQVTLSVA
jgi:organic hydroperoxide reductase OsmC/OhrA